jgi:collagen triple helix repeat protein
VPYRFKSPSPALVVAVLALFVALGGTGYAATQLQPPGHDAHASKQHKPKALRGPKGLKGDAGSRGSSGSQGLQGISGSQGLAGLTGPSGQNGSPGPSDIYATGTGSKGLPADGTLTEVASLALPAGTYLVGATIDVSKQTPDPPVNGTSMVSCRLQSTLPQLVTLDLASPSLLTDTSYRSSLSLAGAATLSSDQAVKVSCSVANASNTPEATNAYNIRLWAIKPGNLHAVLPLPND